MRERIYPEKMIFAETAGSGVAAALSNITTHARRAAQKFIEENHPNVVGSVLCENVVIVEVGGNVYQVNVKAEFKVRGDDEQIIDLEQPLGLIYDFGDGSGKAPIWPFDSLRK